MLRRLLPFVTAMCFATALSAEPRAPNDGGPIDAIGNHVRYHKSSVKTYHRVRRGGLICGAIQMRHFGITDRRYKLAKAWLDFRRAAAAPGMVVVQSRKGRDSAGRPGGHVARIVQLTGPCRAIVSDEKGQYERDICKRRLAIVDPSSRASLAPQWPPNLN